MLRQLLVFCFLLFFVTNNAQTSDPNTDPNWDWINGDYPECPYPSSQYRMYIATTNGIQAQPRSAPWGQGNAWIGLQDMKREDGWVLVARDFGTPYRAIYAEDQVKSPYFMLYNKYRGLLRFFIMVRTQDEYTSGAIELRFNEENTFRTATLTHLKPRAYATDRIEQVKDNLGSALTIPMNSNWAWADFPMAYDPTITPTGNGSWLDFRIVGTQEASIVINGTGTGLNGSQKAVKDFLTGASNGAVTMSESMPTEGITKNLETLRTKVLGTSSDWGKWETSLTDLNNKLPIMTDPSLISVANNNLKLFLYSIENAWYVKGLPFIGGVVGLVDFFTSGGIKSNPALTAPTYFGFNLELKGTITTKKILPNQTRIQVPTSKLNPEIAVFGSNTPIVYNKNLGILNLTKTPTIKFKDYMQWHVGGQTGRGYDDFQVQENLNISINPDCGLVADSIMAWMVIDPTSNLNNPQNPSQDIDLNTLASWTTGSNPKLQLESSIDGRFVFRTIPVPAHLFKYQTIQAPYSLTTSDVTIKIKAVLHRADDPGAQPVVFVATYEPNLEDAGSGTWPSPPSPFSVKISRLFENGRTEELPAQYGFVGTENVTLSTPATIDSYVFAGWSDGVSSTTRTFTNDANLTAYYKAPKQSNTQTAFSNSSQRKFIRTPDGYYHLVYESMGKIWYERSTDGINWTLANNGKPLNNDYAYIGTTNDVTGTGSYTVAKQPSLDCLQNTVFVVWEEQSGGNYVVRVAGLGNGVLLGRANSIPFTSYGLYSEDVWPQIAIKDDSRAVVAIRRGDNYFKGLEVHYLLLAPENGGATEQASGQIPGTNQNTINFTLATDKVGSDKYHVAWQQSGTSTSSIMYAKFIFTWVPDGIYAVSSSSKSMSADVSALPGDPGGHYEINIVKTVNVSNSTSYTQSSSPSMIGISDGSVRLAFKGYIGGGRYCVSSCGPDNLSWIPYLNKYGGQIFSSQISLGSDTYFVGWTEYNGGVYKTICTDSHTLSNKETIEGAAGRDMQINMWGTKNQQFVMGLNSERTALPYSFTLSKAIGDIVVNSKKLEISSGRGIFLTKDESQLYFTLGNITIDGVNVDFIKAQDTVNLEGNLKKVNSFMVTEPFSMKGNSNLSFAAVYGTRDSSVSESRMKEGDFASFKVELIDDASGRVIGSYLSERIDKKNIFSLKESAFKVTSDGIGDRILRLRVSVAENMKSQYTISDMFLGDGILLSKSLKEKEMSLEGSMEVKEYSLSQNYPNPFNPTTVINYALPKESKVTLKIYDILGKEVATLVNGFKEMGTYSVEFNASSLPSGIYIYEIRANDFVKSGKMMLLK